MLIVCSTSEKNAFLYSYRMPIMFHVNFYCRESYRGILPGNKSINPCKIVLRHQQNDVRKELAQSPEI